MSLFQSLACLLNQHRPVRRDVIWDGRNYIGVCRHCETPIQRVGRKRWRRRSGAGADRSEPHST